MKITIGDGPSQTSVIDLSDADVDVRSLRRSIRDPDDDRIQCARPGPLHDSLGYISPHSDPAIRPSLALAMRSRRTSTPVDRALATAQNERNRLKVPNVDLEEVRRAVAETRQDKQTLRERVARLGGKVSALREAEGGDPSEAMEGLRSAATALSEAETDHLAAVQQLEEMRREARKSRDVEHRRLQLTDKIGNLRQEAREYLVETGWDRFTDAVGALPRETAVGPNLDAYAGPGWVTAMAILHIAEVEAPVVVEGTDQQNLATPSYLGTTVIRV